MDDFPLVGATACSAPGFCPDSLDKAIELGARIIGCDGIRHRRPCQSQHARIRRWPSTHGSRLSARRQRTTTSSDGRRGDIVFIGAASCRAALAERGLEVHRFEAFVLEMDPGQASDAFPGGRAAPRRRPFLLDEYSQDACRMKNTSSTSWVCAALPCPGGQTCSA
jgi:hypothetical protein